MALSACIDRYSRPKQELHHAESPDWWIRTACADNPFPMPLERPIFLEETLTKISISTIAERMFLSFAAVALWATVVGCDDDFRSGRASSVDIMHSSLLEPTDFWSTAWTRVHLLAAAILLGGGGGHLRALFGHCRPTLGADDHPVMLGSRPTYTMFLCKCPQLGIPVRDDRHPNFPLGRAMARFFEAVLPEWSDPMTYTIARMMEFVQIKLIKKRRTN